MNDRAHFLSEDYLSLSEEQKEAFRRYISIIHDRPVHIEELHLKYAWVDLYENCVYVWPTSDYEDYYLTPKQELLECVATGMLI